MTELKVRYYERVLNILQLVTKNLSDISKQIAHKMRISVF